MRLQHQVLFGLLQLFLQTLVLGSYFADSLLPVLQQAELGANIHHLLMRRQRTCSVFCFFFQLISIPGTGCCGVTCDSAAAGVEGFIYSHLTAQTQLGAFGHSAALWKQLGVKWLSSGCTENLYFMLFSLTDSFQSIIVLPPPQNAPRFKSRSLKPAPWIY